MPKIVIVLSTVACRRLKRSLAPADRATDAELRLRAASVSVEPSVSNVAVAGVPPAVTLRTRQRETSPTKWADRRKAAALARITGTSR